MTLRYVTVSSRCAIWVGNKQLVYVNGKSIDRGQPELWMFGGGVVTTDEGRRKLEVQCDATDFSGDNGKDEDSSNDLRFWLPESKVSAFHRWLDDNEPGFQIVKDAERELREECENHDLPMHLACQVQFGRFRRVDEERDSWSYQGKKIPNALCYDYIVPGRVTGQAAAELRAVVAASQNLYLITRTDVQGGTIDGVIGGTATKITVPAICDLLF